MFDAPDLSNAKVCEIADYVRSEVVGDNPVLDFNVEQLAEDLGFNLRPIEGLRKVYGLEAMPIFSDHLILIDEAAYDDPFNWYGRLRFTVMHEIGHYFLHQEYLENIKLNSIAEWRDYVLAVEDASKPLEEQANEFAGRFLVPPDRLKLIIQQERAVLRKKDPNMEYFSWRTAIYSRVARIFNVSPTVVRIRVSRERIKLTRI